MSVFDTKEGTAVTLATTAVKTALACATMGPVGLLLIPAFIAGAELFNYHVVEGGSVYGPDQSPPLI